MRVLFLSGLLVVDCMLYKYIYMYMDLSKLCVLICVPKGAAHMPGNHRGFFFPLPRQNPISSGPVILKINDSLGHSFI